MKKSACKILNFPTCGLYLHMKMLQRMDKLFKKGDLFLIDEEHPTFLEMLQEKEAKLYAAVDQGEDCTIIVQGIETFYKAALKSVKKS